MKLKHTSKSSQATESIGEVIGRNLAGGEVIELISDVGGGKTTFMRGLARGAGSSDHVSSPTFTVSNMYKTPKFAIHHLDFYRLHDPGLIEHELDEHITDKKDVVAIEWSDIVARVLPEERVTIRIRSVGEEARELELTAPKSLEYLIANLA